MNLGVETPAAGASGCAARPFQHSLMNLGVETRAMWRCVRPSTTGFQHSLMNLGVETLCQTNGHFPQFVVSAFSDESWGGDPAVAFYTIVLMSRFQHSLMNLGVETKNIPARKSPQFNVSAFSDESWGGDRKPAKT